MRIHAERPLSSRYPGGSIPSPQYKVTAGAWKYIGSRFFTYNKTGFRDLAAVWTGMMEKRRLLYELLGELPPRERPVRAVVLGEERREAYTLETLLLDLNGIEPAPAYFTRPHGLQAPAPAILYNHAHGGDYVRGKEEFLQGNSALQSPPYAEAL